LFQENRVCQSRQRSSKKGDLSGDDDSEAPGPLSRLVEMTPPSPLQPIGARGEVDCTLEAASTSDGYVGSINAHRQGLSAGELVLSMAETNLGGGDFMITWTTWNAP
jgi:hypothetical protein